MHDLESDPTTSSTYECLACGAVVSADTRPGICSECGEGGTFQNRALSLE